MAAFNYYIGSLDSTPVQRSTLLNETYNRDVYRFSIDSTSSINLNLHEISTGDADLKLYRDSNSDGSLDSNDPEILRSSRWGTADDSINYLGSPDTYFAVVDRYPEDAQGRLDYELDLSATPQSPSSTSAPNLLPKEIELGTISTSNQTGLVGNDNTADTYYFSVSSFGSVQLNASLTGLTADADIRLVQDSNDNRIVDSDEILAYSSIGSSSSDSLSYSVNSGDYFVQVYQFSENTDYNLSITA
jgi:hypothetical protein